MPTICTSMNMTLSASPDVIHEIQTWAAAHNTSLDQIICDALEEKAKDIRRQREKEAKELMDFLENLHLTVPPGWKFDRETANQN